MSRLSWVAVALFGSMLIGCQSMAPSTAPGRSLMAGKTTFVEVPGPQGTRQLVAYTESGDTHVCAECQAVAAKYMETGTLDEAICKTCGATLKPAMGRIISH